MKNFHNFKRVAGGGKPTIEGITQKSHIGPQSRNASKSLAQTESITLAKNNMINRSEEVTTFEKRQSSH